MSDMTPIAFDIETDGFSSSSMITVAGFYNAAGNHIILNTDGRSDFDRARLVDQLENSAGELIKLEVVETERQLLDVIGRFMGTHFTNNRDEKDDHYLCAFNGETWKGGFDLPFCRTRYIKHDMEWPFNCAYIDVMKSIERFNTTDEEGETNNDLVGSYNTLIGEPTCDPFDDSSRALETYEAGEWLPLLEHNFADIKRTYELAKLTSNYLANSDIKMKNLTA